VTDRYLLQYVEFFENMTLGSLGDLSAVMTDDVQFSDPFNSVLGLNKTRKIFADMFDMLESPRFRVTHAAMTESDPGTGLLRWEMEANQKHNNEPLRIVGMSEIHFAADGRVTRHIDHWDAGQQVYEKLPVIGWLVRKIRKRLEA